MAIKKRGGILILVTTSEKVLEQRMGEYFHDPNHHIAEHHLDHFKDWDYVIENNGSLEELQEKVGKVVEKINASREEEEKRGQ
jgi:dephospho-CoA kinase